MRRKRERFPINHRHLLLTQQVSEFCGHLTTAHLRRPLPGDQISKRQCPPTSEEEQPQESEKEEKGGESDDDPLRTSLGGKDPSAMGGRRPCLLPLVLMLTVLCASFPQGLTRNIKIMRLDGGALAEAAAAAAPAKGRGMAEVAFSTTDYDEPGANTNPRSGYPWIFPPPDPQH